MQRVKNVTIWNGEAGKWWSVKTEIKTRLSVCQNITANTCTLWYIILCNHIGFKYCCACNNICRISMKVSKTQALRGFPRYAELETARKHRSPGGCGNVLMYRFLEVSCSILALSKGEFSWWQTYSSFADSAGFYEQIFDKIAWITWA